MTVPAKCDVCETHHHKHQAHVFAKPVPIQVAKETLACMRAGGTFRASAEGLLARSFVLKCGVCGKSFDSRRPHAKTCSPKCRQRKRRAKP